MVIGLIDIIVLLTLVLSVLFALYRGLVCELLCISSWILAGLAALYSFNPMAKMLSGLFDGNDMMAGVVGSGIVGLLILVVMTVVNAQIVKRLRASSLSGLDRIFGFVFGCLRAVLLLSLVYIAGGMVLPETKLKEWEENNFSMPYIQKSVEILKYIVPENILTDLNVDKNTVDEKQPKIGTDLKRKQQPKDTSKKALGKLIEEVKKPSSTLKPFEVKKEKQAIDKSTSKSETVNYKESERESLDIMVEAIAGE